MEIKNKIVIVTGGASGIGAALCRAFKKHGAGTVVVADRDQSGAEKIAAEIDGVAMSVDVRSEEQIRQLVDETHARFGAIDLFCSNAGIFVLDPDSAVSSSNDDWQRIWEINVMAHVYATRALLPHMKKRRGYFLITASAAGLLSQIGSAPYSVTKHAAVGFAESLAIAHREEMGVSVLCPQAVRTAMTDSLGGPGVAGLDGMLEAEVVAEATIAGIAEEQFLILPHPEVLNYLQRKATDYDRWLGGMRKLRDRFAQE